MMCHLSIATQNVTFYKRKENLDERKATVKRTDESHNVAILGFAGHQFHAIQIQSKDGSLVTS